MDGVLEFQVEQADLTEAERDRVRQAVALLHGTGFWVVQKPSDRAIAALDDPAFADWLRNES